MESISAVPYFLGRIVYVLDLPLQPHWVWSEYGSGSWRLQSRQSSRTTGCCSCHNCAAPCPGSRPGNWQRSLEPLHHYVGNVKTWSLAKIFVIDFSIFDVWFKKFSTLPQNKGEVSSWKAMKRLVQVSQGNFLSQNFDFDLKAVFFRKHFLFLFFLSHLENIHF